MRNNIEIICGDNHIDEKHLTKVVAQITDNIENSNIFNDFADYAVRVLVNVNRNDYPQAQALNSKIMWMIEGDVQLSNDLLRNFLLRCIHLNLDEQFDNLLIVFYSKKSLHKDTDNSVIPKEQEDDAPKSFVAVKPKYKLNKIILSDETKRQIHRAIALIKNREKIYEEWGFSEIDPHTKTVLCFYGSPGTGKTMCAHALASELNKKILIASYASIESKWVGEGPKNLQKIFSDAETQDAILFFDEADSFLSKRVDNAETGSDKHYNRMSNEMFQLLEDYNGIVIFATNLVSDFDKAFKSRILAFIEFQKPDLETRKKLIQIMIPPQLPMLEQLSDSDLEELAHIADGFSGREIRKAMLITLSEGAMNNILAFSKDQFIVGFNTIKEDTAAIESSISGSSMSNCIADFMQYANENTAILNICLKTLWQFDNLTDLAKQHLVRICSFFNQDMPDLSISYINKDITEDIILVSNANRLKETAMYSCELYAYQMRELGFEPQKLDLILAEMKINNKQVYHNYVKSLIKII